MAQQYLVPKDGTPLSGLIQDHMIAGVRLSLRGRFFGRFVLPKKKLVSSQSRKYVPFRTDYHQLVYQALPHKTDKIVLLPPAIIKPMPLWSGKQILSTVIINIIPKGKELINLNSTSKISATAWRAQPERKWEAGGTPFR